MDVVPVTTRSEIEDGVILTGAKGLTIAAVTTPTITTSAVAGTGGDSLSIGGAVAITVGDAKTVARIGTASGTTTLTGGLSMKAYEENGTIITSADGTAAGKDVGIGVAVAINLGTEAAVATTERAMSAADKVTIDAKAVAKSETTAKASVKGGEKKKSDDKTFEGSSTAVNTTTETLTVGANKWKTGDAVQYSAGGGTAIGGLADGKTYYIITTADTTKIKLAASAKDAAAGTAIDLTNTGSGAKQTLKQTSQAQTDKQLDFTKEKSAGKGADTKSNKETKQDTSDGPVGVAAAIAVNVSDVIADAAILAGFATTGDLAIHSSANGDAIVKADGSAVVKAKKASSSSGNTGGGGGSGSGSSSSSNSGDGIGVGVGVNLADVINRAHIGDATHTVTVSSHNLSLAADMAARAGESGSNHTLTTTAIAGAGAPEVGVAGAVAINVVSATTTAFIEGDATVSTGGNDLTLTAVNTTTTAAAATSKSDDGTRRASAPPLPSILPPSRRRLKSRTASTSAAPFIIFPSLPRLRRRSPPRLKQAPGETA